MKDAVENSRLDLEISWCTDPMDAETLGQFFASNVTPDYISHSELQGPRALDPQTWAPNLVQTLSDEIRLRVNQAAADGMDQAPILVARAQSIIVGIALVSFFPHANVPYVIIEDLVVAQAERGRGTGQAMLQWIFARAIDAGCGRAFLESGLQNKHAHHFFEQQGFRPCSVVMMKPLAREPGAS
jgi:GNAT superfamily N-acetyltransferase